MKKIFIDPSYHVFEANKLFDLDNPVLNRDGQLLPFYRLRESFELDGDYVQTADYLFKDEKQYADVQSDYYSLGILGNFERILVEQRAKLAAFIIMEPPVVAPSLYKALPRLTELFDKVYLHNVTGDGYSLEGVNRNKLNRLYWPIPHDDVLEKYWANKKRMKRIVVINGSHNPASKNREQYSLRIEAMSELSNIGVVDLYGMGWDRWWSRQAMWWPYWKNRRTLMKIYNGKCNSKFEVLQNYEFCLCFENMSMNGYITEKIFDCIYSGTIPLYLGAPNINDYIPENVFIDCRNFTTWKEMWEYVSSMSEQKINMMKRAGRDFLKSDQGKLFYESLDTIFRRK